MKRKDAECVEEFEEYRAKLFEAYNNGAVLEDIEMPCMSEKKAWKVPRELQQLLKRFYCQLSMKIPAIVKAILTTWRRSDVSTKNPIKNRKSFELLLSDAPAAIGSEEERLTYTLERILLQ